MYYSFVVATLLHGTHFGANTEETMAEQPKSGDEPSKQPKSPPPPTSPPPPVKKMLPRPLRDEKQNLSHNPVNPIEPT